MKDKPDKEKDDDSSQSSGTKHDAKSDKNKNSTTNRVNLLAQSPLLLNSQLQNLY